MQEHINTKQQYKILSVTSPVCHNILQSKTYRKYYNKQAYKKIKKESALGKYFLL